MNIHKLSDGLKLPEVPGKSARAQSAEHRNVHAGERVDVPAGLHLAPTAEFDAARVEAIKQAMREGRFQVNADAVAERLIESVRELIAHKA